MPFVGYAYLHDALNLKAFAPQRAAMIKPVTRITLIGDCLAVPQSVAPAQGSMLEHILFALKHEGVNLCILAQALEAVSAEQLLNELAKSPNGVFIRKACFLWKASTENLSIRHRFGAVLSRYSIPNAM